MKSYNNICIVFTISEQETGKQKLKEPPHKSAKQKILIAYRDLIQFVTLSARLQIKPQVYDGSVAHRPCFYIYYEDIPKYQLQVNGIVRLVSHSILQSVKACLVNAA